MHILLTNDDGIRAEGIAAMRRKLVSLGEVEVVAPQQVQSATGHGITIEGPLMTREIETDDMRGTAVEGSPADCVKLAVSQLLPDKVDLVVSGINHGANVGINVIYSGTVAAAVEAAFLGLPAIAVSLHLRPGMPNDMNRAAELALPIIDDLADRLKPGQIVSLNLPALAEGAEPAGVKVCRQCFGTPFVETYAARQDPSGNHYFWNTSVFELGETDPDTDVAALRDGFITVTPLHYDLTAHDRITELKAIEK